MDPTAIDLLALAALGGLVGLDTVSCAQAMVSRPIVAGPLAGLLLGDVGTGMLVGILLEIVSLNQLPIGAARHWDTGPAAVGAAAAAVWAGGATPSSLVLAVGYGVLMGWAGGWSMHGLRRLNGILVGREGGRPIAPGRLSRRHLTAMGADFVRAAALTAVAAGLALVLATSLGGAPAIVATASALLLVICLGLAIGVGVRAVATGRSVALAFGGGAVASAVLWLWLS